MLKIIGGLFILALITTAIATLWSNYDHYHDQDWWR